MLDILVYYGIMGKVGSQIVSVPDRCFISILQNYPKLSRGLLLRNFGRVCFLSLRNEIFPIFLLLRMITFRLILSRLH